MFSHTGWPIELTSFVGQGHDARVPDGSARTALQEKAWGVDRNVEFEFLINLILQGLETTHHGRRDRSTPGLV